MRFPINYRLGIAILMTSEIQMSSPAPAMTIQDGAGANYIVVGHEPFSINNRLDQKVMQLTNNLTYVNGDHTYTLVFLMKI